MPLFIVINLLISFFAQEEGAFKEVLQIPLLMYISLGIAGVSFLISLVKKWQHVIVYDVFISGILVVWFSYWLSFFKDGAPMFFIYPVYFAMLTAIVTLFLRGQQIQVDKVNIAVMQKLSSRAIVQPWVIMICLFISLELRENFLFFPTMVTLFIIRFALDSYLKQQLSKVR